jgi:hypothetical protein
MSDKKGRRYNPFGAVLLPLFTVATVVVGLMGINSASAWSTSTWPSAYSSTAILVWEFLGIMVSLLGGYILKIGSGKGPSQFFGGIFLYGGVVATFLPAIWVTLNRQGHLVAYVGWWYIGTLLLGILAAIMVVYHIHD